MDKMLILKIVLGFLAVLFFGLQFYPKSPEYPEFSKLMINCSAICALLVAVIDPISMYIMKSKSSFSFPALSTFADYNERLILTNYSSSTVSYNIVTTVNTASKVFQNKIVGEIAAKGREVLKSNDIVTITGSTQFSALINISAPPSLVDVSVTKVHIATGFVETITPNIK
jgi:hypothetical protein